MATVKKGMLTAPREWWKHLRETKREFWKAERKAAKQIARRDHVVRDRPDLEAGKVINVDGQAIGS